MTRLLAFGMGFAFVGVCWLCWEYQTPAAIATVAVGVPLFRRCCCE